MLRSRLTWIACPALVLATGTSACVPIAYRTDAVTYGPGRDVFAGHSVDYGDAKPVPGTNLVQGATVRLEVRVRYSLQSAEQGRLALFFPEGTGVPGKVIEIVRTDGRKEATLSHEFTVPTNKRHLYVLVGVFPGKSKETAGALRLHYHVVPPD
jgi:hypothetical protein